MEEHTIQRSRMVSKQGCPALQHVVSELNAFKLCLAHGPLIHPYIHLSIHARSDNSGALFTYGSTMLPQRYVGVYDGM